MIRVIRATEIDGVVICALTYETSAHTRVVEGGAKCLRIVSSRTSSIIVICAPDAEKSDKERSKSSSFPLLWIIRALSGPLVLPRKNFRYLTNESNLDGPHRLDNDIDLTVTLSNDRGRATWWAAASKEGSLEI